MNELLMGKKRVKVNVCMGGYHDVLSRMYDAGELVDLMAELKLYVNKTLALEIAKKEDAIFYLRRLLQNGRFGEGAADIVYAPLHRKVTC